MMPFEFRIDLEKELSRLLGSYRVLVPKTVVRELKRLSRSNRKAKASLKLIERFEVIESNKEGDESILEVAEKTNGIVITNDRELKNRLKEMSVGVIFLRAKKKLVMESFYK
jgi:hypothetical protein